MVLTVKTLVDAHLYPSQEAVVRDALRSLLLQKPQLRIEVAVHRYMTEDISLAKAAHLAGVSFDQMKALLAQRGVQLRLGATDEEDAQQEVAAMQRILADQ